MKQLLTLALVWVSLLVQAEEKITSYVVDIQVNPDRSLTITEEITVNAEGKQIRRGILRDIPLTFIDSDGNKFAVDLEVIRVLKNGQSEDYSIAGITNGKSIRIGNADVLLDPGIYSYTIEYRVEDQVRFFSDYDEVYWNAIGTGWAFPIDQAKATMRLPEGSSILQHSGYSGPSGSTACDCEANQSSDNTISYRTNDLGRQQGLTIAVGFTKGVINPPSEAELRNRALMRYMSLFIFIAGVLLVLGYYLFAWKKVGVDPDRSAIIPRFEPPNGLSPAAVRYIHKMGFDSKAFAAMIVHIAIKGAITIDKTGKDYVIRTTSEGFHMLSDKEKAIASELFAKGGDSLKLGNANHAVISEAINALKKEMDEEHRKENFAKNYGWLVPGFLMSVLVIVLGLIYLENNEAAFGVVLTGVFVSIFAIPFVVLPLRYALKARTIKSFLLPGLIIGGISFLLISILSYEDLQSIFVWLLPGLPYIFFILSLIVINALFVYLIQAPTVVGRRLMDEIEGLKMYMEVAEKHRLNMMNPPEKTPQLFEKLLPYAIALGIESEWANQFESMLAKAMEDNSYRPTWYAGRGLTNFGYMSRDLGSNFSSSISSSSMAPQSSGSSGSGGGGSSGGGGGGGGGGGW